MGLSSGVFHRGSFIGGPSSGVLHRGSFIIFSIKVSQSNIITNEMIFYAVGSLSEVFHWVVLHWWSILGHGHPNHLRRRILRAAWLLYAPWRRGICWQNLRAVDVCMDSCLGVPWNNMKTMQHPCIVANLTFCGPSLLTAEPGRFFKIQPHQQLW